MTIAEAWPIIAGAGIVVFGAGQIVEKIRNGRYLRKDFFTEYQKTQDERWTAVHEDLVYIRKWIDDHKN